MITLKSLFSFVIPSSILGLSWFWWKWKNKVNFQHPIEDETKAAEDVCSVNSENHNEIDISSVNIKNHNEIDISSVNIKNHNEIDMDVISNTSNVKIDDCIEKDIFSESIPEAEIKNIDLNETVLSDVGNKSVLTGVDINVENCITVFDIESPNHGKRSYSDIEIEADNQHLFSSRIESIDIGEGMLLTSPTVLEEEESNCNNDFTLTQDESCTFVNFDTNNCKKQVEDEEVSSLMINPVECEILTFDEVGSDIMNKNGSNSINSELSVDCLEDLDCDDSGHSNTTYGSGKRLRNQLSCGGDSAIVEDYSSDGLSITGSDSAIKSSESEVSEHLASVKETMSLQEESSYKKGFYPKENGRNYRDWYGSALAPFNSKERCEKRHWGSVPVSDSDSDNECILKRTAKIGSVSLDKLSIVLNEELSKYKSSSEKMNMSKSPRRPKQSRRRGRRKSENSRPSKKPVTPKPVTSPKRNDSSHKQKTRKSSSSRKDIDKPWRKLDMTLKSVDGKRETIEYEFPDDMCGRLIGKSGRHISEFKETTGVDICIECELHGKNRVVSITGVISQIKTAEKLLNEKFNDSLKLLDYPDISDVEKTFSVVDLPENTDIDVIITAIVDVANFYIQIFNSDVDEKIMQLQADLSACYANPRQKYVYSDKDFPEVGDYCVSYIDNVWCRLKVLEVLPDTNMVDVFFIDYGGNINLPLDGVWKIRPDMLETPAQAVLCNLDNVVPIEGDLQFSYGANDVFYQLVEGKVLQACVLSTENGIPRIRLSWFDEERGQVFSISEQMHLYGLGREASTRLVFAGDGIVPQYGEFIPGEKFTQVESSLQFGGLVGNENTPQFVCAS